MNNPLISNEFLTIPLAHRGLHDLAKGLPENSSSAVQAAISFGYGIEIDVQLTADDAAVVFHDYTLERLTDGTGSVRAWTRNDLATLRLAGARETVPSLPEILELVAGQVPVLIELKDQDGALGDNVGTLEAEVARNLEGYSGPLAVMSFNPHSVSAMQALAPEVPRGLVTEAFLPDYWDVPEARLTALQWIEDFDRVGASFISHNHRHLGLPAVADLKYRNVPVLCWTVRSPEEQARALQIADNITFEGYLPPLAA